MNYNKDTDYQEKINEAVKSGDYESAAVYEKQRNEKIDSENLPYQKTNNYAGWLDKNDYSTIIKDKISSGASRKSVAESLKDRIEKSSGTIGLSQYAYDDVYDEAIKYIAGGNNYTYKYEETAPEFKSDYDSEIKKLYDQVLNMKKFSYDLDDDELYKYYKEQYNREGKRAMEDLLGTLSMNTGGVPSSYAVSAAGQVLDEYNAKLTDKIPELYQAAYERYIDSAENSRENLITLTDLENDRYERYLDELNQFNEDRDFNYRAYADSLENDYKREDAENEYEYLLRKLMNEEEEFEEKLLFDEKELEEGLLLEREKLAQELLVKENELDFKRSQQDYEKEYKKIEEALKKWQQLGYLDSESAKILGLPSGLHTVDYDYKRSR